MQQAETIVLLFALVAALVIIARKLAVPYPVFLVLGGLALSFIPRLPEVKLNPNIVFYFFLPPLIYPAALFTSWRDFRRNLRPILLLAIGLVLFTMVAIAYVAHSFIPALPWAAAFALGAIVSPPDAIAATSVIRRLSVPHRIEAILEGESLVNDATALVALQFAVVALMTGSFSLENAALRFVWAAIGGVVFGLLVGWVMRWVQRHLDDHCSRHFSRICPRNVCMFRVFWPRSQPGFISAGIRPSRLARELVFRSTLFGKSSLFFSTDLFSSQSVCSCPESYEASKANLSSRSSGMPCLSAVLSCWCVLFGCFALPICRVCLAKNFAPAIPFLLGKRSC